MRPAELQLDADQRAADRRQPGEAAADLALDRACRLAADREVECPGPALGEPVLLDMADHEADERRHRGVAHKSPARQGQPIAGLDRGQNLMIGRMAERQSRQAGQRDVAPHAAVAISHAQHSVEIGRPHRVVGVKRHLGAVDLAMPAAIVQAEIRPAGAQRRPDPQAGINLVVDADGGPRDRLAQPMGIAVAIDLPGLAIARQPDAPGPLDHGDRVGDRVTAIAAERGELHPVARRQRDRPLGHARGAGPGEPGLVLELSGEQRARLQGGRGEAGIALTGQPVEGGAHARCRERVEGREARGIGASIGGLGQIVARSRGALVAGAADRGEARRDAELPQRHIGIIPIIAERRRQQR